MEKFGTNKENIVELHVRNVFTRVVYKGDTSRLRNALDEALAVKKKGYYFSKLYRHGLWDGRVRFYYRVMDTFPTGLLGTVKKFLNRNFVNYVIVDERTGNRKAYPELIREDMLEGVKLRDYQIEAIKSAIEKQRGIIYAATNSGKTEIAAGIMKVLPYDTIYFVHRKELLYQTAERLKKRLGNNVGIVCAERAYPDTRIKVTMIQTAYRRVRTEEITRMLNSAQVLFLDECHVLNSPEWVKVAYDCPAFWRFGLSGTPFTGDTVRDLKLIGVTGEVICRIRNIQMVERGYSSVPIIYFHYIQLNTGWLADSGDYFQIYNTFIVENEERNRKICEIARKSFQEGKICLILVRIIRHGLILENMLRDVNAPFIFGMEDVVYRRTVLEKFKEGKVPVLIASTIADEGLDISNIRCLILAAGGKSKVKTLQRIGRALRRKEGENVVEIHDFIDDDGGVLYEHSEQRKRVCEEEGFIVRTEERPTFEDSSEELF